MVPCRKGIDKFLEPLMEDAIAKWNLESVKGADAKNDDDDKNENLLLEHLVKHTQGKISVESSFQLLNIFLDVLDKSILKDEVM